MSLEFEPLYRSEIVTVVDVRCRPHGSCPGGEEASASNDIVFPRRGCFIRHIGRHRIIADANTVHYFRKDEGYHISHPATGGDDCTSLTFAPELLADAFATFDAGVPDRPDDPFGPAQAACPTEAFVALQHLRRSLRSFSTASNAAPYLAIDEIAIRLLEAVARSAVLSQGRPCRPGRAGTVQAHRDLVERTRIVLSDRMGEPLTLPEIARGVHSSPFHLARVFRRMTGSTLHKYLTALRLRTSLEHLAEGASDLTALALTLGFSSHSHFSDAFRRAFRATPTAFRLGL